MLNIVLGLKLFIFWKIILTQCSCKFWNRKIVINMVCIMDDICPCGLHESRCENIWSRINNNFVEYAFIVNLASIRYFKGYNVAWLIVYEKNDIRLKIWFNPPLLLWWYPFLNSINSTDGFSRQDNFGFHDDGGKGNGSSTDEILEVAGTYFLLQACFCFFFFFFAFNPYFCMDQFFWSCGPLGGPNFFLSRIFLFCFLT